MEEKEAEEFVKLIDEGLYESQKMMLKEHAMRNSSIVVSDGNGGVKYVSAKEILEQHPELRV
ncbi:MAG: hypothetical protein Q4F85_13090 [Prevotella sp.]|nr:hypothetical protein [Prevotella sp.]